MQDKFSEVFELTALPIVEESSKLRELLNTELCLGMTRWVCRHGTLGEGFEKLTDAQKYYQAIRECYLRGTEIKRDRAMAKKAYADYLDAQERLKYAVNSESDRLRAEADIDLAELQATELAVKIEDTLRQLDEFNKVRLELQDKVRAQYPKGIEQSEPDSWREVMRYRMIKGGEVASIPLPLEHKGAIMQELLPVRNMAKMINSGGSLSEL